MQGSNMGFAAAITTGTAPDLSQLTSDDLIKFGLIPEFVGRFPNIVALSQLTRQDMMAVLTEVKNNYITQYQWIFQQDDVKLEITVPALEAIVDQAVCSRTGARSLQGHLEKVLMPHMFELAGYRSSGINRVVIDADQVNNPTPLEDAI
jgi:ATP-dependent Clp protease ATP-binding subunit ClpX